MSLIISTVSATFGTDGRPDFPDGIPSGGGSHEVPCKNFVRQLSKYQNNIFLSKLPD
jgi:hypothetical protein